MTIRCSSSLSSGPLTEEIPSLITLLTAILKDDGKAKPLTPNKIWTLYRFASNGPRHREPAGNGAMFKFA
jgi:hypothetical protein